jgi:hypothetical protein
LGEVNPQVDNKIAKDIFRTIPGNTDFSEPVNSGQNRLYNVLKAYSTYDPEIGYAQGMNFIAVVILTVIPEEEDAFWAFVFVMSERGWRDIFNPKSDKIAQVLSNIDEAMLKEFP